MAANRNAVSAAYTQIMVNEQLFPRTIHAKFNRTGGYTRVTVDAFFLINLNNRSKIAYIAHYFPLFYCL
jgi:hypothetical protein